MIMTFGNTCRSLSRTRNLLWVNKWISYQVATHILIGHVPVRPFPIGHDLPHDNAITPHVACRGEFTILDGFCCGPSDGYFSALFSKMQVSGWSKDQIHYILHLPLKYQLQREFWRYTQIKKKKKNKKTNFHGETSGQRFAYWQDASMHTSVLFSCVGCDLIRVFQEGSEWRKQYGAGLIDSQLLCRQPQDRRRSPLTGRSQTLYIRDCCWQGCFARPDLDGHIPYRRDISFPLLCPAASRPTGWLWIDHRVSARHRETKSGQPSSLTMREI